MDEPTLDEIGKWSEIKLEIIREYAKSYSQILAKQPSLYHLYIDGFAGAGMHVSKKTRSKVAGSPLNVIGVEPKFREYHLVELDETKAAHLRKLFTGNSAVHIYQGDCNEILPQQLLPNVRYDQFRRGFCLLDPYGLHLDWNVVRTAGQLKTIDLLLHFPMMDMNMNVLWRNPDSVNPDQAARMTRYWGDESWESAAYANEQMLFGVEQQKTDNDAVAEGFRKRLSEVAGFRFVPAPLPMRNSTNAIVYYLFFASHNQTAHRIIRHIFTKRRQQGGS